MTTIKILVENTVYQKDLVAEHGFSAYIEAPDHNILFDTGQTGIIMKNAAVMGVNLRHINAVVLSHGHYDHTGGLAFVLDYNKNAHVYGHPGILIRKFARHENGTVESIGINENFMSLVEKVNVTLTAEPLEIARGIWLTGEIPRRNNRETIEDTFVVPDKHHIFKKDIMVDDQSLVFRTEKGSGVLLGCAHAGVINTFMKAREITGQDDIAFVIGGMHLINAAQERLDFTVQNLREMGVRKIICGHCTGEKTVRRLYAEFPGQCATLSVGSCFEMDKLVSD